MLKSAFTSLMLFVHQNDLKGEVGVCFHSMCTDTESEFQFRISEALGENPVLSFINEKQIN